jgi:formiminotetrahydrofolate cyclodeaminase
MSLMGLSARELLDAFAAPTPTPGGGSAAAFAGAMGAALLAMVASLPKTRSGTSEDAQALGVASSTLNGHRQRLQGLVDEDSRAYEAVMRAYRLPKDPDPSRRRDAIQLTLRQATDVPLEVMRITEASARVGAIVARHGNPSAASDVGVGLELLRAASAGAALNVRANLTQVRDADYVNEIAGMVGRLESDMKAGAVALSEALDNG